jgi:hypothetical protein
VDNRLERARQRMRDAHADLRQSNRWVVNCAARMRASTTLTQYQHWCGEAIVANEEAREAAIVYHDALATYLGLIERAVSRQPTQSLS